MNSTAPLHVVLGAGQIGPRVRDRLLAQGHRVRMVRRSAPGAALPGLEWRSGDITDPAFAAEAMAGAAVVYDCTNPQYHQWDHSLLPLAEGALGGAARAGAKLVALDCLYAYGRPAGPLTEDSPIAPCSKKGELRARQAELRWAAHRRGDVRVTIGRASDFFGADLPQSSFGDRTFLRMLAGKPVECMGDPDQLHSYSYVDDVARGLVTLGAHEQAVGKVWHLPVLAPQSTRALVAQLGRALGVEAETARMLRGLGVFSPFLREVVEMTYQWEAPFVVDDGRFRAAFGEGATPVAQAIEATARWARERFQVGSSGVIAPAVRPR